VKDCVSRIMSKRKMAKGGEVEGDDELAGFSPNEFDILELEPGLEFSYDKKNSGDELDNEQQDEDRADAVTRIMAIRRGKRQSNPRPA
jgi:hypothetical protein